MARCTTCEEVFDVEEARNEYASEFDGEFDYDEEHGGERCADCAICETNGNMARGRAILMMNGDEDYDDDFVMNNL